MRLTALSRRVGHHIAWRAAHGIASTADTFRRGDRVVITTPPVGPRFGNWLYLWLDADQRTAEGTPTLVLQTDGMAPWLEEFPHLRKLTVRREQLRFHDRREWDEESPSQRFGVDFTRSSLDRFILSKLAPSLHSDAADSMVINVRRGDYYSNPGHFARYGWDIEGYLVDALASARPAPRALIVSDDPRWCRVHLDALVRAVVPVVDYAAADAIANFRTIAGARFLIGTNSTFSYWGGYVSRARFDSSEVIMPRFHARFDEGADAYQLDPTWTVIEGHY